MNEKFFVSCMDLTKRHFLISFPVWGSYIGSFIHFANVGNACITLIIFDFFLFLYALAQFSSFFNFIRSSSLFLFSVLFSSLLSSRLKYDNNTTC